MTTDSTWEGSPFTPRAWQREALPVIVDTIKQGRAAIVSAVTGAGKSVLIAELIATALERSGNRAIVLTTPTQALVAQLAETVAARVGWPAVGVFYGKKKQPERRVIITCNPSTGPLAGALAMQRRRVAFLICDEVHKTEGEIIRKAIVALRPACRVGFTATPFRADEAETLQLWESIAYQYTLSDAWRDEVLVPFVPVNWSGDGDAADVDRICLDMMRNEAGPGVVSALSIDDAERFAMWLTAQDFPAEAVHSRRKPSENKAALSALLSGALRCVVHVSMLSEGVDIPALRWICLRRPVGSRVRFVQEVGRVLRTMREPDEWGPKTSANVLDPHDLFSEHGIAHPAALGEPGPKEPAEPSLPTVPGLSDAEMPPAVQVDIVSSWARSLVLVLQAEGMAAQTPTKYVGEGGGSWRRRKPSPRTLSAVGKMRWAARFVPEPHRATVKWIADNSPHLRGGAVSDVLGVLIAVADASKDQRRGWTWPAHVSIPELETANV